jgi:hypothetical protein
MSMRNLIFRSPKTVGIAAAGILLLLSGAVWAVVAWSGGDRHPAVPKDLTVASLQAQADDPAKIAQTMRDVRERKDLTEEQRREVFHNARQVFEAEMDKSLDEYFTAPPEQKTAVLDRQIDRMQQAMKAMGPGGGPGWGRRPDGGGQPNGQRGPRADGQNDRPQGGPGGPPGQGNEARRQDGQNRGPGGGRGGMSTPDARKRRSESRDPDRTARRMAFFGAVAARAKERGIQMPFPGGRGPMGGMGGGPGHP